MILRFTKEEIQEAMRNRASDVMRRAGRRASTWSGELKNVGSAEQPRYVVDVDIEPIPRKKKRV